VDTPEDFALIREVIGRLYSINNRFRIGDVIALLEDHPDLAEINGMIRQKEI
jgi:spore coat polysaccharide biosynthesis protein SpsF (cytidylyltransferase family)